jgi:hypothetical protein
MLPASTVFGQTKPRTREKVAMNVEGKARDQEVQKLLSLARSRAKNVLPKPSITGLVVAGDDDELQIATRDGIVGVPVKQILQIAHPIISRDDIVTLFLPDLESIRTIFPVKSIWQGSDGVNANGSPDSIVIPEAFARGSCSSSTAGAGESMTAGEVAGVNADDSTVHYQTDDCE